MGPSYKLTYFNVKVLAEPIRMIFAYAGVPFEDVRIPFDKWAELKPTMPWGQLPVLEFDGNVLTQCSGIGRYLAKQYGLAGENDYESAKCDEYVDVCRDFRTDWRAYHWETNEEKKATALANLKEKVFPNYLPKFSKAVESNGGSFLVGKKLSWADFFLAVFLELYETTVDAELLKDYPNLKTYQENIFAIPQIKDWIEKRPKALF